jgi:hypothetical protein
VRRHAHPRRPRLSLHRRHDRQVRKRAGGGSVGDVPLLRRK